MLTFYLVYGSILKQRRPTFYFMYVVIYPLGQYISINTKFVYTTRVMFDIIFKIFKPQYRLTINTRNDPNPYTLLYLKSGREKQKKGKNMKSVKLGIYLTYHCHDTSKICLKIILFLYFINIVIFRNKLLVDKSKYLHEKRKYNCNETNTHCDFSCTFFCTYYAFPVINSTFCSLQFLVNFFSPFRPYLYARKVERTACLDLFLGYNNTTLKEI